VLAAEADISTPCQHWFDRGAAVMTDHPTIRLTQRDFQRLSDLADAYAAAGRPLAGLEAELSRAEILGDDAAARGVATVDATVEYEDENGARRKITLVLPHEADIDRGRVSVATPVGSALLGLSVGQTIDWTLPDGRERRYRVLAVSASRALQE
jgi:regulator of nucleoside diphosphate kinase